MGANTLGYDMGADVVAWRNCQLQLELGPAAFLGRLKLLAYKSAIDDRVPAGERDAVRFTLRVGDVPGRDMGYAEITAELGRFADGIPECADCPLSGGKPLGCCRYLTFPIDEAFEQLAFDYFIAAAAIEGSPSWQIAENVIPRVEAAGTAWHLRRYRAALTPEGEYRAALTPGGEYRAALTPGGEGADQMHPALAMLPRALEGSVKGLRIDSAQLMQALFISLENPGPLHAYAAFWAGFVPYARARVKFASSRTLTEIAEIEPVYRAASEMAKNGRCSVLVDS